MILKINPLNDVINFDVDKPKELSRIEFWNVYFKMLNLKNNLLTDKEIEFLSYFITHSELDLRQISKISNIAIPNCYSLLKRLVDKGFIEKEEDYKLNFKLLKFVNFIEKSLNKDDVIFDVRMPIKINKL